MNFILTSVLIALSLYSGSFYNKMELTTLSNNNNEFRAAKYSLLVDLSLANEIMKYENDNPVSIPKMVTVYHYFIQYGDDRIFHILEPESNLGFMGIFVNDWNYTDQTRKTTLYLEHVKKYSVSYDSIRFSYTESTGLTENLCTDLSNSTLCDSVKYISYSEDVETTVCFDSSIANIPFYGLLFPDIRFLPIKIYGWGSDDSPLTLDYFMVGKSKVDSLLDLFTFKDFSIVNNYDYENLNSMDTSDLKYLIEMYDQATKGHD